MSASEGMALLPRAEAPAPAARPGADIGVASPAARPGAGIGMASPAAEGVAPSPPDSLVASSLALYAQVLDASTLEAAVHRLVATLAAAEGCSRVAFGLHERHRTRVVALSSADLADAPADLLLGLQGAMDEAIDQACAVAWPVPDGQRRGGVADLIRLEQQALHKRLGGAVASLPLGQDGAVLGALCLQREAGPPFTARELQRLSRQLQLATPALRWMQLAAAPWRQRIGRDLQAARAALRQPERRWLRRSLLAAALGLAGLSLVPMPLTVSGRARIEGGQQRVLVAPSDGFVKTVHVRPGDRVKAGAPLIDLLEQDLQLEADKWQSQLAQHENAYASAMARADRLAAATAGSRVAEAQSQLALVAGQLQRGRIVAPFDGLVVQGDLGQSLGAPVRQGDALLTLASTGRHRVIVDIDETDIAAVQPGQAGQLALSSLPWQKQALQVARIAPLARAVEGRNVFEVEAGLLAPGAGVGVGVGAGAGAAVAVAVAPGIGPGAGTGAGAGPGAPPADGLRPGLLGRAELTVGREPPLQAWLGQAARRLRLAWWSWLG